MACMQMYNLSHTGSESELHMLDYCLLYSSGLLAPDEEITDKMPNPSKIPWGGILALLGGFLIQLTLGSFYSFGNVMTYMTSYMR